LPKLIKQSSIKFIVWNDRESKYLLPLVLTTIYNRWGVVYDAGWEQNSLVDKKEYLEGYNERRFGVGLMHQKW
jgi:hypothetical protein